MLSLFISNLLIWGNNLFYTALLTGQLAFYALAVAGFTSKTLRKNTLVKIPYFFMQVNIAIAHAGMQFLAGKRITKWEPSKR